MESDAEMRERHGRLLARFAEQAASLAEDLHAAALAAETPEEKRAMGLAFHRTGRALRQTLALEAKLRRDAERGVQAEREAGAKVQARRVARRKDYLKAVVTRLVWTEHEDDEDKRETLIETLDAFLAEDALEDGFAETSVEAQLQRLCDELRLTFPGWIPNPPPAPPDSPSPPAGEGVSRRLTDEGSANLATGTAPRHPPDAPRPCGDPHPPPSASSGRSSGTDGWMG